jgi:protocatechuate 3,4-dioxygenase beta subunit
MKRMGLAGAGLVLSRSRWAAAAPAATGRWVAGCWITPQETEGPYYFDPALIRRDITSGKTGVPLQLAITVIDSNCRPLPNVLVDAWHADKDGVYSGYVQPGGNTVGQTFLRGTQISDANGQVIFDTIYPGWYMGRATHIHFKARITDTTYITSQFAFPEAINAAVYATPLYTRGANPTSNAADGIFRDSAPEYLMLDVTGTTAAYTGTYAIGIDADLVPVEPSGWGAFKRLYR